MENPINRVVQVQGFTDVVLNGFESLAALEMRNVLGDASDQVIHTEDLPAVLQQPLTKV